ncbi:MAG: hemolysin III family protein [Spirochaetaceae bacterium]|jgi:hemolysin III|nr:hemolysin III family protein [Spirochaetaceae bacterium]
MEQNRQSAGEEIANSALHSIGGLLGIAGLVLLVNHARSSLPVYVIFASAMILMFAASAVYHGLCPQITKQDGYAQKPQRTSSKTALIELFRTIDHQAIYIFIAGTYTPFCLLALKGTLGLALLIFEWVLALAGIILSAIKVRFLKKAEMVIFILMGWAILAGCIPLARYLPLHGFILLFAGGLFYTAGTFFYRAGKARPAAVNPGISSESNPISKNDKFHHQPRIIKARKRTYGAHVVWHLFVMAGAACHWLSVWSLCRIR